MKLNKTLLSIGTIAAVATPVATVVACGDSKPTTTPPVKGTKGGTTPGNQGPTNQGPISPVAGTVHHDPVVTKAPATPVKAVELDKGILDYRAVKTFTNQQLNEDFAKFNTDLKFAKAGSLMAITSKSKPEIDLTRNTIKVMLVTDTNSNHGSMAFYIGIIGYAKGGNAVYFTFRDALTESDINNDGGSGSEKQIKLFDVDYGDGTLFDLINGKTNDEIINDLETLAAPLKI